MITNIWWTKHLHSNCWEYSKKRALKEIRVKMLGCCMCYRLCLSVPILYACINKHIYYLTICFTMHRLYYIYSLSSEIDMYSNSCCSSHFLQPVNLLSTLLRLGTSHYRPHPYFWPSSASCSCNSLQHFPLHNTIADLISHDYSAKQYYYHGSYIPSLTIHSVLLSCVSTMLLYFSDKVGMDFT